MSDNKPNWVDYANLASNVAQNVQLGELHSTLRTLASLEAQKAVLEENRQQALERENRLREFIWRLEDAFDSYVQRPNANPCGSYIVAKQMIAGLEKGSVTTASFSQFADKDRFGRFFNRLQQTLEDSIRALPPSQMADAETYVRYEAESPELDVLIQREKTKHQAIEFKLTEAKKRRKTATKKLEELRALANAPQKEDQAPVPSWRTALVVARSVGAVILGVLAIMAGLVGILAIGAFLYCLIEATPGSNGVLLGSGVALLVIAGVLVLLVEALLPKSMAEKPLQDRIRDAEEQIAAAERRTAELKDEKRRPDWELNKFNARSLSDLLKEQERRVAFMLQLSQANNL